MAWHDWPDPITSATFGPLTTFVGDTGAQHAIVQATRPKAKRSEPVARDGRRWVHPTKGWRRGR